MHKVPVEENIYLLITSNSIKIRSVFLELLYGTDGRMDRHGETNKVIFVVVVCMSL